MVLSCYGLGCMIGGLVGTLWERYRDAKSDSLQGSFLAGPLASDGATVSAARAMLRCDCLALGSVAAMRLLL